VFANLLFITSALMTVVGAILVASSKNVVHACIYLLVSLLGVSGLYITLGAEFVAATQLVVYVGGVVILLMFAIMLTGGAKELINNFGIEKVPGMGNTKTFLISFFSIFVFFLAIFQMFNKLSVNKDVVNNKVFEPTVEKIGMLLVNDHVLAFEISSVLLLGALVGAAIIARPRQN
jgi:NADH-quinone oxidoreductase subunit J